MLLRRGVLRVPGAPALSLTQRRRAQAPENRRTSAVVFTDEGAQENVFIFFL